MLLWGPPICCKIWKTFLRAFGQNCTEVHKIAEKVQWGNICQDCGVIVQKSNSCSGALFQPSFNDSLIFTTP